MTFGPHSLKQRLRLIALAMGGYILLVIWPSIDAARLWLAEDAAAFSLYRFSIASAVAVCFTIFSYIVMMRLTAPDRAPIQRE